MITLQIVDELGRCRNALAHLDEERIVFLGVMDFVREFGDVPDPCAQKVEVLKGRNSPPSALTATLCLTHNTHFRISKAGFIAPVRRIEGVTIPKRSSM